MKIPLSARRASQVMLGVMAGLSCWLPALSGQAQVGLSPLVIESELTQGRAQGVLKVTNTGNQTIRLRVYSEPFTYEPEQGFTSLEADGDDLSPYLQFSPREIVIPPQSDRRVRIIATIPSSQEQKEYRAVIFTETLEVDGEAVNAVGVVTRVGATLYVRAEDLQPELSVMTAAWNAEAKQIQLRLDNEGASTARPWVEWQLKQGEQTIATGRNGETTVVEGKERLLRLPYGRPGQSQALNSAVEAIAEAPKPGNYQLTGTLNWRRGKQTKSQAFSLPLTVE